MSIFSIVLKGGWLLVPIFIASVVAGAIIIDRYFVFRKSRMNVPSFMVKIRSYLCLQASSTVREPSVEMSTRALEGSSNPRIMSRFIGSLSAIRILIGR